MIQSNCEDGSQSFALNQGPRQYPHTDAGRTKANDLKFIRVSGFRYDLVFELL